MRTSTWFLRAATAALLLAGCDGGDPGRTDSGPGEDSGAPDGGAGFDAGRDAGFDAGGEDAGPADAGADVGPFCVDEDGDGYGDGCALGPDCDDGSAAVSPTASEICNGIDDDCDVDVDEELAATSCALGLGVCAGSSQRCGLEGLLECDATDYGADFEATETLCDGLDNDCDGSTDEGCACVDGVTQACGSDVGACTRGLQTCAGGSFGACEGEVAPMGEVCDGADNDCDASVDEAADLTPPSCPLQLGVCAGSRRTCGGVAGWIACSGVASYGGDYQTAESLCDGLDNDCDGVVDEGCECIDGSTQSCGSDLGACTTGTQTCVAGAWGTCAGAIGASAETCDGLDNDCDGTTDEDLTRPLCALQAGVCSGRAQRCTGAGGFVACTAADYGAGYELSETLCDGQDNDCDSTVDEGCACVDGTTQACGSAVGSCTRGMQACSAGTWGACSGGVGPAAETCNGLDDDCNGAADDSLVAPPCALTLGVCSSSRRTCGGAAGWQACSGTDSYGPTYRATEPGATDEAICDGLDNDCDGEVDDDCASGPLVSGPEDAVMPGIYNRHLAYSVNFDGNWDIVFQNLDRGGARRITTTPENELGARVSGNHLVFLRGTDATQRAVLFNLETGAETVLSTQQTDSVEIAANFVVWDELNGGRFDVVVYDIVSGTRTTIGGPTTDEFSPSIRGGLLAYVGTSTGTPVVHVAQYDATARTWGAPIVQTPGTTGGAGHRTPHVDFVGVSWTDGRAVSGTPTATSNWNLYGAPWAAGAGLLAYPSENAIETSAGAQIMRAMDSQVIAWDDNRGGNWDIGVAVLGGAPLIVTSSSATQAGVDLSGIHLVWHDNRLGGFDIYQAFFGGALYALSAGAVLIAEVLADPAADVNGDGVASTTQDEYVELVNVTGQSVSLSGATLSDATGVRHTFPPGTILPSLGILVVFSGGTPTGNFGGAVVQVASTGALGLHNDADTLTLALGATVIDTIAYGAEAGADQSIVRNGTTWLQHTTIPGAVGRWSPGLFPDGFVP